MQLRLSSGQDDPANAQREKGFQMRPKVLNADLANLPNFPDIAHDAAAIAAVMREEDEYGQFANYIARSRVDSRA